MKIAALMLCMLCATAALGQLGSVLNNEAHGLEIPSHSEHASQQSLAQEQSILGTSNPTFAHGERPLWEVAPVKEDVSLGQAARMQRKLHANDKKAPVIWHN